MGATEEEVYRNWMLTLARWVTTMYNAGKETGGEAFVGKIEAEFRRIGTRQAQKFLEQMPGAPLDCTTMGKMLDFVDTSYGNYWDEYTENSPQGFEKNIRTCPVANIFSRAPEICTIMIQTMGQSLVSSVHPDASFQLDKVLSRGDPVCHYRAELKDST